MEELDRVQLLKMLTTNFSTEELNTIAFSLGVDWDDLPGNERKSKGRELITYLERNGRLNDLRAQLGGTSSDNSISNRRRQVRRFKSRELEIRRVMMHKIRNHWIEGVLEKSLYGAVMLELGLDEAQNAVERPWQMRLEYANSSKRDLPSSEQIGSVFDQLDGQMLILGEPGSGKTTTLLQLARELLNDAEKDVSAPIPVVLNLSSWGFKQAPLDDWLVAELNTVYGVRKKYASKWLQEEPFHLLLDGLDEVHTKHRESCVEAINAFRQEYSLMEVVICCRHQDYIQLGKKLSLNGALLIQPLQKEQIDKYLAGAGSLEGVHQALVEDPQLMELTEVPLTLSIITLTYRGRSFDKLGSGSIFERRHHLFNAYISQMFDRQRVNEEFDAEQAIHWLSFLAARMAHHAQSVFYLEGMQPSWLLTDKQSRLYWRSFVLSVGIIVGLIAGAIALLFIKLIAGSTNTPITIPVVALSVALIIMLIAALRTTSIEVREQWRWSWVAAFKALKEGKVSKNLGQGGGPYIGTIVAIIVVWILGFDEGLLLGIITWMSVNLIVALIIMLNEGLSFMEIKNKVDPGKGIRLSGQNGLVLGLVLGVFLGLVGGLSGMLLGQSIEVFLGMQNVGQSVGLILGLTFGLSTGLYFGLINGGGSTYIMHYILRSYLTHYNHLPRRLIPFLNQMVDRILLQRVGNGFIFIHRMLLEYFASLEEEHYP